MDLLTEQFPSNPPHVTSRSNLLPRICTSLHLIPCPASIPHNLVQMHPSHGHLRNCASCQLPHKRLSLYSNFLPSPSHFRQVTLTAVHNRYVDPVHRKMFLPIWKYCEVYERLYEAKEFPYKTENVAYCLKHLLEKVNERSGVGYSVVYTETGRVLNSLTDLPDFFSRIVLGIEQDQPPSRTPLRRQSPNVNRNPLVLSSTRLHHSQVPVAKSQVPSPPSAVPISSVPPIHFLDSIHRSRQASHPSGCIALSGEGVMTLLTDRDKHKTHTREATPENRPQADRLETLFSPDQMENIKKEFTTLLQFSMGIHISQATKIPVNMQKYLYGMKAKTQGAIRAQQSLAAYLQRLLPGLQGKPLIVFKAILRGLEWDGRSLSWSQWMLLNALIIYQTASDSHKIAFITRVKDT